MTVNGPLCGGCPLEQRGTVFIPFVGSGWNKVMLYGDSGWMQEAKALREQGGQQVGTPFSGPSGYFVERNLKRIGTNREQFVIANSLWCRAERLGFTDHPEKFPEVASALRQCAPYTDDLIRQMGVKVIVPMGNAALRRITGIIGIERNHGYLMETPYGIPAMPTFHPSYILKGNQKLSGPWCFVVERAVRLAEGKIEPRKYDLLLDPALAEARAYFDRGGLRQVVCDIETVDSDNVGEDEREEISSVIIRVSFSNQAGTGISMPWQQPYLALIREVLAKAEEVIFWNQAFDQPRLVAAQCHINGKVTDAMFAWHWLQSDLPKALAFVAPMFALIEPWKYLSSSRPAYYSAMDSAVTMDCYLGIRAQLEADGRWEMFERHCTGMFPILSRMSVTGVKLDIEHQGKFKARLERERDAVLTAIQHQVPNEVKPVKVYKRKPSVVLPFNPASSKQVLSLIRHLKLPVPKGREENQETTEAKHLKKLVKKNSIFRMILDYRERSKLIDSYMWAVDAGGRVHSSFSFHPSTWRKSARNPNVQTVPKRNDLAQEFRRMVIASPGHVLIECDSSAIEAVLVGYFAGSQRYIDLAKAGVHKWLASQYAGRVVGKDEPLYDQIKRVVHLSNYMGTPMRIHEEYPDTFASVKEARKLQEFYFAQEPVKDVSRWHQQVMVQAHRENRLQNPFKYRHYFFDVLHHANGGWSMGDDAKRSVAFLPQSTASAIQTEYVLAAADFPLLAPCLRWIVHDSIIMEVPVEDAQAAASALQSVMTQPIAELGGLSIGVEVKVGPNLAEMSVVNSA